MRRYAITLLVALASLLLQSRRALADQPRPRAWIGYTHFRTNLPGGRYVNEATMRARIVRADGSQRWQLADRLSQEPHTRTQFAGWSPDGKTAIIGSGWESPENGKWEEEHKRFRFHADGWRYDMHLLNLASGRLSSPTAVDRVSFYNTGLFFWPGDASKLGFQALIEGVSHPFVMDRDGKNKTDLTTGKNGFTYGFNTSPDGKRVAYHKGYNVYIAAADGSKAKRIRTGKRFNFMPQWSPDGKWLMFLSGEHYNCHPTIVRADGGGLRKLADRGGYRGVVAFLDVYDFHGGSSDIPTWSPDSRSIYYTAQVGESVELMRVDLAGKTEQLTHSSPGTLHYHPEASPDGKWIVFGSKREGIRNLYIMSADAQHQWALTDVQPGHGAMWAHWQPAAVPGAQLARAPQAEARLSSRRADRRPLRQRIRIFSRRRRANSADGR